VAGLECDEVIPALLELAPILLSFSAIFGSLVSVDTFSAAELSTASAGGINCV
jgi:hypothetical protein